MSNKPQIAKISTTGKWESGVKTSLSIRNFPAIVNDEPDFLGGTDEGPMPLEVLLTTLSSCTSVLIAIVAKEQEFEYTGVQFKNSGEIDLRGLNGVEGVRTHFQKVNFNVEIETEESNQRVEQLKAEVERRCPVYNLLVDAGVTVEAEWQKQAQTIDA